MEKTKHTPGPWTADNSIARVYSGARFVADAMSGQPKLGAQLDEDRANARLIASAPDLLEACETILSALRWEEDRSGTTYNGYESLQAAIAKAKGD